MSIKKIFCNPANVDKIKAVTKEVNTASPDLFVPFGYEIIADPSIPEYNYQKTGRLLWKKEPFVNYGEPASLDMPWDEYVDMCIYFRWCEEEVVKEMVFYEIDTSSLFGVFDTARFLNPSNWSHDKRIHFGGLRS